jgi:CYTH domain-containing protein
MAVEIERKFLVVGDGWRERATSSTFRQGYLSTNKERTVRIRVMDQVGLLTVKGITVGAERSEFEYEIPVADAKQMLEDLCERPLIEKVRHVVVVGEGTWEIDEFSGVNAGLIVAEIELDHADQPIELPPWIGTEVTDDPRYFNSNLITHPYNEW